MSENWRSVCDFNKNIRGANNCGADRPKLPDRDALEHASDARRHLKRGHTT